MPRLLMILSLLTWSSAQAAAPAIGVATCSGSFALNHAQVTGSGTVFDGALIETARATSRVRLESGAWIELAAESRATIFAHKARLEDGFGEVRGANDYAVEARGLRIVPAEKKALARIRLDGPNTVLVAAMHGAVRVYNQAGLLVANMNPGAALSFQPEAGAADTFQISGCLLSKEKHYIVVDATTSQTVEVQGDNLAAQAGNRVQVTGKAVAGAKPAAGASQVIRVEKIEMLGRGGCVAAAAGAGASTRPAEAAKKHTGAIVAGVLVAGAGGGVAAAVCCKGSKTSTSP